MYVCPPIRIISFTFIRVLYQQSPYIMRLRGTNRVGDALLFFLEPAMGGPLHQHLRRLPGAHLDEDTVMLYTAELLSALAHMHSRSCIHRDLKASNCLLDEAGHIKLCDFSAAKQMGPSPAKTSAAATVSCSRTFTVIGTAEFMSPEMLLRSVGYTFATDVWSLGKPLLPAVISSYFSSSFVRSYSARPPFAGVLMYEMLVGRRPFTDPARHWLVAGDERGSDRDPASEGEVSPGDNDRRVIEFFEQHCQSHLNCPARGGDELDEFDPGADPISAAAWSLLSERLLAPTEAGRLPTTDNLEQAREHPFLRDIDWVALEAHALPPVDIDRTVGQLHLLGSPVGEGTDEDALSEEQQRMFDGF